MRADCFALVLKRSEHNPKMKAARVESDTASVRDSLLKSAPPRSSENLAKIDLPGIHCNHLPKEEMQFPSKHIVERCFSFGFTLKLHTDQKKLTGGPSEKTNIYTTDYFFETSGNLTITPVATKSIQNHASSTIFFWTIFSRPNKCCTFKPFKNPPSNSKLPKKG